MSEKNIYAYSQVLFEISKLIRINEIEVFHQ